MAIINISGTELYYRIIGSGVPIVMLHGWGMDHRLMSGCMEPVLEQNQTEFKRIYIDLPGMGKSKAGEDIKCSDDILEILCTFIDEVIPGEQFILAGESYGGYLSRGMVKKRADQIRGLLLICPLMVPGYRKGTVSPHTVLEREESLINELQERERSCFEYITVLQTRKVWEQFRTDIYDSILHQDTHFLNHVLDGAFTYNVDKLDRSFDKPCLILTGRQDTEVGYKDQFSLLNQYIKASYAVLDRAGHNLQIEQAQMFKVMVREWLRENF